MSTETRWGSGVNAEAIAAWDGPLYEDGLRAPASTWIVSAVAP